MYRRARLVPTLFSSAVIAALCSTGCSRGEQNTKPVIEAQSTAAQPANDPVNVSGCLRSGEADTYVLTASQTADGTTPATYQLLGQTDALRDQVGTRIEVTGTVRAKQQTQADTGARPSEKATGTSGTPTVETMTQVDIRQLQVSNVKPLGDKCDK
jgi:hypothetical protein